MNTEITAHTIEDTEPNKALSWTTDSDIPSGIIITPDANSMKAALTGTPSEFGDFEFRIIASNDRGSDDVTVKMTVYTAPVVSDEAEIKAVEGHEITRTISADEGNHLVWKISGDIPDGLNVTSNDASFTVSGTPANNTAGDYECTLTASNMAGSDDLNVIIYVYSEPALSGDSSVTVYEEEEFSTTITAVSGNNLTWEYDGTLPDGVSATLSDRVLTISGTPSKRTKGSYNYSVRIENYADYAEKAITINVLAKSFEVTSDDVSAPVTLSAFLNTLTASQIAAIETLKLNEYFTDLSGLDSLTSLKTLDLKEATALEEVDLSGNTTVTRFELAGNESVKTLDFSLNAIRKFDARGFTQLENLECEGQIIMDTAIQKNFAFRDFLSKAEFSVVAAESKAMLFASGINPDGESDDTNVKDITGYNSSGTEIDAEYDSKNGIVIFSEVPYIITYNYMALEGKSMDVTI